MKKLLAASFVGLSASTLLLACEDELSSPMGSLDSGTFDSSTPPDDASFGVDSSQPSHDAGTDADASFETDAGSDAGIANALYAHINQTLVSVDPMTGAITTVGITGQTWIVLAWDATAKVARVVLDPYSPANGAATPKLGTIDLCTGAVTAGPAITLGGNQIRRAEGLAQDPATGTFYISYGTNGTGTATEFLSEKSGTIDVATGAVTQNGSHDTLQDDGDALTFIGPSLKLLDVATSNNSGALYALDKTNGAASSAVTTGPALLRVAYDPTRDVVFTAAGTGTAPNVSARSIGTLDVTTGTNTPLGTTLGSSDHAGHHFGGLLSAPAPECP